MTTKAKQLKEKTTEAELVKKGKEVATELAPLEIGREIAAGIELLKAGKYEEVWQRYCGWIDLSL